MEGTEDARGVNFRTLEELFRIIKEREKQYRHCVSVGVLEVYNEQIRDLLTSETQPGVVAKRYHMVCLAIPLALLLLAIQVSENSLYKTISLHI